MISYFKNSERALRGLPMHFKYKWALKRARGIQVAARNLSDEIPISHSDKENHFF